MSYTVLARRYRSKDFDDLIGQEPIAKTLRNAIETNRVAHAYLFCGTRGVGKTSTARILAKALNCVKGPTAKPCNKCDRCKAISAGEDIDVIEIDGASNRGIDEIRNLRSNAIYRPARSPYKIYIIDEVHMLTKEAFNALLKTLEEPPSHVKFFFATTEPQRVPQTISSRCQEFNFRLIPTSLIADRLAEILKAEKTAASQEVISRVARAGRGSMRDALSLLDQLLAMGADRLSEEMVEYLLGEPTSERMLGLANALADGDAAGALARVDQLLAAGYAPEQFVVSLIEHLRRLMLIGIVGQDCDFLEVAVAERQPLAEQAGRFAPVTLVYMVQVLEQLRQSVRATSAVARALIDAAVVRLALLDQFADTAELVERLAGEPGGRQAEPAKLAQGEQGAGAKKKPPATLEGAPGPAPPVETPSRDEAAPAAPATDLDTPLVAPETPLEQVAGDELWNKLIGRLSQARMMTLAGPLAFARLLGAEGSTLKVQIRPDLAKLLSAPHRQEQLQAAASRFLARPVAIEWVCEEAASPDQASTQPVPVGQPAPAVPSALAGPPPGGRLSRQELDQVVADATVRGVMDIFNADVVSVERKGGKPESK